MKNIIIIDEIDRDRIQKADIEASSLMNLITFMVNHNVDISNERFLQYEQKYQKAFLAFENEKFNLEKKYLTDVGAKSWNLSYETRELTYEK